MNDQNAVIKATNLSKSYAMGKLTVNALTAVDLSVGSGEFTALVGPSGSGKTTLLHLVSGLDAPTTGEVWLGGTEIGTMSGTQLSDYRRDHIGFIFQSYNLIPVLTARENIEYILVLQKVPEKERRARVDAILADVGLTGMGDRFPNEMSGGQQQRVAVARAMVSEPDIILADEPTANLDSATGTDLIHLMRELNEKKGMTFLFSTHDPKIVEHARRLVVLRDGKIESDEVKEVGS